MKAFIKRILPGICIIIAALLCTAVIVKLTPMPESPPPTPTPDLLTELRVKGTAAMPVDGLDYVYVTARLTNPDRICTSMLKNASTPPLSMHCYPVFEKSK